MTLATYLAQDRVRALARNEQLPDRTTGSALFADISGFTSLTESLKIAIGTRRGAEELTHNLDTIFTNLIAEVETKGGSVLGFAGDAITCWFDDADGRAAPRAITCAFAMQTAMTAFSAMSLPGGLTAELTLKAAVATGPARRFVIGNPDIHYLDALAGTTVARTATAEHLAARGEILVDEATVGAAGSSLSIREWRTDVDSGQRFAVVTAFNEQIQPLLLPALPPELDDSLFKPWMHPVLYERERLEAEFRPCVVLFIRFLGIDYEADDAQAKLDKFIRQAQDITDRYEGILLQLIIGDKGSYFYISFGAVGVHEDDARRAIQVALRLRAGSTLQVQMGISQGMMLVGTYGGLTRRTFGVLGDDVNLAARLMQTAAPEEILLSGDVHKTAVNDFVFEPRPPLAMKGKAEPLPVFAVTGKRQQRAIRLQEPRYALPMVGRQHELQTIEEKLDLALAGQAQIIGIVAEAGLGKSRLVAEAIRAARSKGFAGYGGTCRSDAVNMSYEVWKSVWAAFFDVDPDAQPRRQIRWLEGEIEDRAPERVQALPLLGPLLNITIPDNTFTQTLEPKIRHSTLHALLEDCLKAAAREEPILIVIEDLHWIDALSHDLLDELARATADFPICFVLAYRPPQILRLQAPKLETLPQFTKIKLRELTAAEAEDAIRAKLAQLYPARSGAVPPALVDRLMERAQGNPFYLEELLNFLRDRGLDPREPSALDKIMLPDSLHTLILSRIDQLSEQEKTTLRLASILGRSFRVRWLAGCYPNLGQLSQVKAVLDELESLDITSHETSEPELTYLFKHIVTHEVTYESLPFSTRARLHEQLGRYLETTYPDALPIEILAYHYGRSHNTEKQRYYLQKAGDIAQKNFANDAALAYYEQLLPLLDEESEKIWAYLQRGKVLELMGRWDESEVDYEAALEIARFMENPSAVADAQFGMCKLHLLRGDYDLTLAGLDKAQAGYSALDNQRGLGKVLGITGEVFFRRGDYVQAYESWSSYLGIARQTGDPSDTADALNLIGQIPYIQGDYTEALPFFEESLAIRRSLGDKWGISATLNNLGATAWARGDFAAAHALWAESLTLKREMGDKRGISTALNNLGNVALAEGDYTAARSLFEESLVLDREMGDLSGASFLFYNLGLVAMALGEDSIAQTRFKETLALRRERGEKWGIASALNALGYLILDQGNVADARQRFEESLSLCQEMDDKPLTAYALLGLGLSRLAESAPDSAPDARQPILESLQLRQELGEQLTQLSSLVAMAGLALHEGNPVRAAQYLGAVSAELDSLNAVLEPELLHYHAKTLTAVRAALDKTAFEAAWETGEKTTIEEAVKFALETYQ